SHASYLINLASPKPDVRTRSIGSLAKEVERCAALGIEHVVVHPGAHLGAGAEPGITAAAEALVEVLQRTAGSPVSLLVENTAGQGTYLGGPLEQLGAILRAVDVASFGGRTDRIGVCFDTCHAFVFGYDLRTAKGFSSTWKTLDIEVGLERVMALHLNDTAEALGSRRDRHARIGAGRLGLLPFRKLVNDRRLHGVPAVVETPPDGADRAFRPQLELLRSLRR
ncbi:MAG: deoxyribonuclease IV, partial [Myxococcota bacterium]